MANCGAFVDRQVVLQTLVSKAEEIQGMLTEKDIQTYRSLIDSFHNSEGLAAYDEQFQRHFRVFYGMNSAGITTDFMTAYFKLMRKKPRRTQVNLARICTTLQKYRDRKGRESLQFSFCTKLAATLNPDYPIYDACVAQVFQFTPPSPPMPYSGRLQCCLNFYNECLWPTIKWLAFSTEIAKMNKAESAKIPEWSELSTTKKIDFLIWTAGKLLLAEKKRRGRNR